MSTATVSGAQSRLLVHPARAAPAIGAFLVGAGPIALLAFSRGGYSVGVVAGYGVALWWLTLVGIATGVLLRPRPTIAGWATLAGIAGLATWGALSLTWSSDAERGLTEIVRLVVALGTVVLGMSVVRSGHARVLAGGVLAGLAIAVGAAVLSRLQPELVPTATQTGEFLVSLRARLAWPLNYWNAVGACAAIGIPLALVLAVRARTSVTSGLAAATVPVLVLGLAYTLSRGAIVAGALGLVVAPLVVAPRPVVLRTLLAPGVGGGIALLGGLAPQVLREVPGTAAQAEAGSYVLGLAVACAIGVGLVQAGWWGADEGRLTPQLPRTGPRVGRALTAAAVFAALVGAVAAGAPDRLGEARARFEDRRVTQNAEDINSAERLGSISSNGRYQMWTGATEAWREDRLRGIGLGSWEGWWNPRRGDTGFVRNAHSQPFELLAETGAIGAGLFVLLLLAPLLAGATQALRRRPRSPDAVIAVPAFVAFAFAVSIDWNWQIGAVMVAGMTLAAIPLSWSRADEPPPRAAKERTPRARRARAITAGTGVGALAFAVIVTLGVALVPPRGVAESREALDRGDPAAASAAAAGAERNASFASSPSVQLALAEERAGRLPQAAAAARRATERAPRDWRPWFVLARVESGRGRDRQALAAFRRARTLNPESPLLR